MYGTSRERTFDRWFRYPAGFSPDALRLAADAARAQRGAIVAEPFLGSAASASGLPGCYVVGIEAHPLIADLAATKLAPPPAAADLLRDAAERLAEIAASRTADLGAEHELVRRCFEPVVLERLAALRDALTERPREPWRRHLRWALLGTLRDVASVKIGWPYQRPALERAAPYTDPTGRFLARAEMIAADLALEKSERPSGRVVRGDARSAAAWRRAAGGVQFDACVSSPPYLNNFDYADATRLELYFLGIASSWAEMCRRVRGDMIVATTQQSARALARRAAATLRSHAAIASEVETLTKKLAVERAHRGRGKEYDQVVPSYFADIARVLAHLHRHLAPGGRVAWVVGDSAPYGVYIDTPALIAKLAAEAGFKRGDDITVRSRGLRWRQNGSRHQVPLSERLITFSR